MTDNTEDMDMGSSRAEYVLRLYVAGETARAGSAIKNIRDICEEHLEGRYELEVIDISENPEQAEEADIVAIPTLIKQLPKPLRKVVGDLSRTEQVLKGLDVEPRE